MAPDPPPSSPSSLNPSQAGGFVCGDCGSTFTLPPAVLDRYPGWVPRQCLSCRDAAGGSSGAKSRSAKKATAGRSGRTPTRPASDPTDGVFTDGGASPNPGPGGWGAVYVINGEIVGERFGHDPDTTNNRMELTALIEGAKLIPEGTATTVWSDSNLAVQTINEWAEGWEKRGWKRKTGPVENVDLVRTAYGIYRRRPELTLRWIKAHVGHTWNEYADGLANRWRER